MILNLLLSAAITFFQVIVVVEGGPTLFYADKGKIFRLEEGSRHPSEVPVPQLNNSQPFSLDYDVRQRRLYWSDARYRRISSSNLNGSDAREFKRLNLISSFLNLAVDDVSRLVFYVDRGNDVITMVTMIGGYQRTVVDRGLDQPSSLALDKSRGVIFYTDMGFPPKIASVNYDGSNNTALIRTGLNSPSSIAVDTTEGVLYWCDHHGNRIESFDYRGNQGRKLLLHIENAKFFALDLFGDSLYFSAWNHSAIRRLHVDGGNATTVELDQPLSPQVLGVLVVNLTETSSLPAVPVQCGCSHICVPGSGSPWKCLCPDGLVLQPDGNTCTTDPNLDRFVLFTDKELHQLIRMDLDTTLYVPLPVNVSTPIAIAYDVVEDRVYWTDVTEKSIKSAHLDGSDVRVIRQLNDDAVPDGLELDVRARILFFSDSGNDVIASMKLDGSGFQEVLHFNLDQPRALALDVSERVVYYTDWGSQPRIARVSYDGTHPSSLVTSDLGWPNGLVLDKGDRRLYWCDAKLDRIESVDTNGANRKVLLQRPGTHHFGMDLYNGYLYYSDWSTETLHRMKADGSGRSAFGPNKFLFICDIHVVDKEQARLEIAPDISSTMAPSPVESQAPDVSSTMAPSPVGLQASTLGVSPVILGAAIGGVVLIILIIVLVVFICYRLKQRPKATGSVHYRNQLDDDYAHLHEGGRQLPDCSHVNSAATTGSPSHSTDATNPPVNIYESIRSPSSTAPGNKKPSPVFFLNINSDA